MHLYYTRGPFCIRFVNMKKVICKVNGMSCAACSAAVEKTLNNLPGVNNAIVSLATEEASL